MLTNPENVLHDHPL